jgi:ribonuclease G
MKPVKKQILATTTPDETRVAIIENDQLAEYFIDRHIGGADKVVGNIYVGKVENVLPGISSAFVDVGQEKNAYLYISDVLSDNNEKDIGKILKKGETILVQVAKEAIGTKGMKVTMDISLPGRYLILMPLSKHVGVSRQVEDDSERDRLKHVVESMNPPGGVIVRTEAEGCDERSLRREMKYLTRLWETVKRKSEKMNKGLVHKELGLTFQVVRDILSEDVEAFLIDSKAEADDVRGFVEMLAPELSDRIRLYENRMPLFSSFKVDEELLKLRNARIDLPSGGYLVLQEAESLCAIDVNTGKFTGRNSQEETVTVTNIEAAAEVARQLRLRNIGGIIVIDFIDMKKRRNRDKVMEALARATRGDHAKIKILPITRLGLVEMTRERRRESLQSMTCEPCLECSGSGWVLSRDTLYLKIRKEIMELTQGRTDGRLKIQLQSPIADYFKENKERFEKQIGRSVEIIEDETLAWEDYRIMLE